jgi:hypothetical protein
MVVNGDKHLLFISKPGGYELRELTATHLQWARWWKSTTSRNW